MIKHSTPRNVKCYAASFLVDTIIILHLLRPSVAYISNRNASDINNALLKFRIIPDLLSTPPLHALKAVYPYGYSPNLGNKIETKYLKYNPHIILWPFEGRKFYTLLLVDLDAPSPKSPRKREWLHYLLANIPGPSPGQGEILAPYVRPNPEEGTHRLVFLIYKHPQGRITFCERKLENTTDPARAYFSSKNFAMKYNLGDPLACNFFLVDALEPSSTIPPAENGTDLNEEIVSSSAKAVTNVAEPVTGKAESMGETPTIGSLW